MSRRPSSSGTVSQIVGHVAHLAGSLGDAHTKQTFLDLRDAIRDGRRPEIELIERVELAERVVRNEMLAAPSADGDPTLIRWTALAMKLMRSVRASSNGKPPREQYQAAVADLADARHVGWDFFLSAIAVDEIDDAFEKYLDWLRTKARSGGGPSRYDFELLEQVARVEGMDAAPLQRELLKLGAKKHAQSLLGDLEAICAGDSSVAKLDATKDSLALLEERAIDPVDDAVSRAELIRNYVYQAAAVAGAGKADICEQFDRSEDEFVQPFARRLVKRAIKASDQQRTRLLDEARLVSGYVTRAMAERVAHEADQAKLPGYVELFQSALESDPAGPDMRRATHWLEVIKRAGMLWGFNTFHPDWAEVVETSERRMAAASYVATGH